MFVSLSINGSTLVGKKHPNNDLYSGPAKWKISFNNGTAWSEINEPPDPQWVQGIAISDHGIYVGNAEDFKASRSQDNGMTWESFATPIQIYSKLWHFENRLYIAGSGGIWRTDTNGENWTEIGPTLQQSEYVKDMIAFQEHIIIGTGNGVWYSHDNGQTYDNAPMSLANAYRLFTKIGNTVYVLGKPNKLAKSEDFGATWTYLPQDSDYKYFNGLADVNETPLIATNDKGMIKWNENAQSFEGCNDGVQSAEIHGIKSQGNRVWSITGNGLAFYDKAEEEWSYIPDLLPTESYFNAIGVGGNLVCISENQVHSILISEDLGGTWKTVDLSLSTPSGTYNVFPEKIEVINDVIFISADIGQIIRSADFGETWDIIDLSFLYISDMLEYNGQLFNAFHGGIYVSNDMGLTWEIHSNPSGFIFSHLTQAGDYFMALGRDVSSGNAFSKIYISEDLIDWEYAGDGLPGFGNIAHPYEFFETFFFLDGIYYFYWKELGFFASEDNCKTWFPFEPKKNHFVHLSGDCFYAGGYRGGVVRSKAPDFISGNFENIDLTKNVLHVYPNPVNRAFNISTNGYMTGKGILYLHNVKGQLIKKMEIEKLSSGFHVPGAGLSDGMYFLKLSNKEKTMVGKVMLQGGKK